MGNDQSHFSGLEIQEKALEVTDYWTLHFADVRFGNCNKISVFVSEPVVGGSLWLKQTPLEKCGKNLMIYRHPYILKYISSWTRGSQYHLSVEEIKPLSQLLSTQHNLQKCIGLYSLLKALTFLHENAKVSHNNVCISSIYVSKDGFWRLGAMEYLCKFNDMTVDYLARTRTYRYIKAIDPNEDKHLHEDINRKDFIDVYAFGVLACEILNEESDDNSTKSFLDLCKNALSNDNINLRPTLSSLFQHSYFNHDFIKIHSFLTELPLKTDIEKEEFFKNLITKLKIIDEDTVGSHLTHLILSRLVLLDKAAQINFIPFVLHPNGNCTSPDNNIGLFSKEMFRRYIVPKLLEIFCVRDTQIRLLLLEHFTHYMNCFTNEELKMEILPELLVGIKDTDDKLVSITLRVLSDLVPVLGSASVIGGKRAKLFNDGRPLLHPDVKSNQPTKISQENYTNEGSSQPIMAINHLPTSFDVLPERPSPDGEEDGSTEDPPDMEDIDEPLDNWGDWDINNSEIIMDTRTTAENVTEVVKSPAFVRKDKDATCDVNNGNSDNLMSQFSQNQVSELNLMFANKTSLPDILELDIKNQVNTLSSQEDFDFFQDMEPVIDTKKCHLEEYNKNIKQPQTDLRFDIADVNHQEEGWGDDLDWS